MLTPELLYAVPIVLKAPVAQQHASICWVPDTQAIVSATAADQSGASQQTDEVFSFRQSCCAPQESSGKLGHTASKELKTTLYSLAPAVQ